MRRRGACVSLAALAPALPVLLPSPAAAGPPYVVRGTGYVTPGLSLAAAQHSFTFSGGATDALGPTSACLFTGTVTGTVSGAVGTASGVCGGSYPTCVTTLSATQWTLACPPAGGGTLVVTASSPTLMTSFTATGTLT